MLHHSEHDHDHEIVATSDGAATDGGMAASVVADYSVLLQYQENANSRWNFGADVGTSVVVTYNFSSGADLPPASSAPYGATGYWAYDAAQQQYFKDALAEYSAVTGVIFVEVDGPAMINAYGADVSGVGGWASYAYAGDTFTNQGEFVNAYADMAPGAYGYQVLLHELGHALGLRHPHEGGADTLDSSLDHAGNTVMTYNIEYPYATDLGVFDIQAMQHLYGSAADVSDWDVYLEANNRVVISTGDSSDFILATGQDTRIIGRGGEDTLRGREGDDHFNGGIGSDTLIGAFGDDSLYGSKGDDLIYGGLETGNYVQGGNDLLVGGNGADVIIGGYGDDVILGGGGFDSLLGGDGNDLIRGAVGDDTMYGGDGNDTMRGDSGHDSIFGEWGDDQLIGGGGDDTIEGGYGADTLVGNVGNDELLGEDGDDLLKGLSADDRLDGGWGVDSLFGGTGNDTLNGGDGADIMNGGSGEDTFEFTDSDIFETNTITDFEDGIDTIRIQVSSLQYQDLSFSTSGDDAVISYSNWFRVELENTDVSVLDQTDFLFF